MDAYVLITTEVGSEEEVREKLLKIPEVVEADIVSGIYDIIAKIRGDDIDTIRKIISKKIRKQVKKITSTQTLVVVYHLK